MPLILVQPRRHSSEIVCFLSISGISERGNSERKTQKNESLKIRREKKSKIVLKYSISIHSYIDLLQTCIKNKFYNACIII